MRIMTIVPVIATVLATFPATVRAELTVTTDFEGGSAVVEAIDATVSEIIVRPGGDPARGWPCWWYLRIDGLPGGQAATLVVRGSQRHARNNGQDTIQARQHAWESGSSWVARGLIDWLLGDEPDAAWLHDCRLSWRRSETRTGGCRLSAALPRHWPIAAAVETEFVPPPLAFHQPSERRRALTALQQSPTKDAGHKMWRRR